MEREKKDEQPLFILEPSKVTQRNRKDPITVEGYLFSKTIKLRVTATPEDWQQLADYTIYSGDFGEEFYSSFVRPVLDTLFKEPLRGKHKYTHNLVDAIKTQAGWLYPFLSYWCRRPLKEWPGYLKRFIARIKREEPDLYTLLIHSSKESSKHKDKYSAKGLTACCIEKVYGGFIEKYGLAKPLENIDSFYITYIQDTKKPIREVTAEKVAVGFDEIRNNW